MTLYEDSQVQQAWMWISYCGRRSTWMKRTITHNNAWLLMTNVYPRGQFSETILLTTSTGHGSISFLFRRFFWKYLMIFLHTFQTDYASNVISGTSQYARGISDYLKQTLDIIGFRVAIWLHTLPSRSPNLSWMFSQCKCNEEYCVPHNRKFWNGLGKMNLHDCGYHQSDKWNLRKFSPFNYLNASWEITAISKSFYGACKSYSIIFPV